MRAVHDIVNNDAIRYKSLPWPRYRCQRKVGMRMKRHIPRHRMCC